MYVSGEECLLSRDVYEAIGYDEQSGVQAIQRHVPRKYRLRFGDLLVKNDQLHHNTVLLKEAGLYCFLLRCKRPRAEPFMEWVCEEVLPREVRKLAAAVEEKDKMIDEKDMQIALLDDDLTESQDLVKQLDQRATQLQCNNTGLQGEIRAKDQEIARRQSEIAELRERYVDHCRDPRKDNTVMITRKHTSDEDDEHFEYPYYISRIQRCKIPTKRRWLLTQFPDSEEIVVIDNPNSVHAFNRLEEEGHVERYGCHFKLIDLTREDLYDMGVPPIEE